MCARPPTLTRATHSLDRQGVHISQVRSTTLDTWTADQIAFVQDVGGNTRCNAFWEGALDVNFDRPDGNNVHELKRFIVDKYVNRRYVRRDVGEAVRRMEAGEFGRYYAGVMVRRQGGGEAEEEEDARGKRGVDTVNGVDGARQVVDELLLLDVRDDAAAVADTAQERKDEVDVWGDIEWITGDVAVAATASEHAGTAPAAAATAAAAAREHAGNAPAAAATATAAAPSEKSVDDILALFDR